MEETKTRVTVLDTLLTFIESITTRTIVKGQFAKVFGCIEKLLINEIDAIEGSPELKPLRKALANRANKLLDQLESISKRNSLGELPPAVLAHAVGISISEKVYSQSIVQCTEKGLYIDLPSWQIKYDFMVESIKHLVAGHNLLTANGLLDNAMEFGDVVIATSRPFGGKFYGPSLLDSQLKTYRSYRFVHSHIALATYIVTNSEGSEGKPYHTSNIQQYFEITEGQSMGQRSGTYMFVSKYLEEFHVSIIQTRSGTDRSGSLVHLVHFSVHSVSECFRKGETPAESCILLQLAKATQQYAMAHRRPAVIGGSQLKSVDLGSVSNVWIIKPCDLTVLERAGSFSGAQPSPSPSGGGSGSAGAGVMSARERSEALEAHLAAEMPRALIENVWPHANIPHVQVGNEVVISYKVRK
jgi:hypothetical protein